MPKKKHDIQPWWTPPLEVFCPLCERPIPPDQLDEHHLVPKLKGGKRTQALHRICHRQVHALFSEAELATKFNSAAALLAHPDVQKFVAWVKTRPNGFCERVKRSSRR